MRKNVTSICLIVKMLICIPCLLMAQTDSVNMISLNQLGFNLDWPKRFTAPKATDGAEFYITEKNNNKTLFKGKINSGLGDFSAFNPIHESLEYVVKFRMANHEYVSFPFLIADNLLQNQLFHPALAFMLDSRSIIGTHPSAYGGSPWRDGTFYSFEVPSLIVQYLANQEEYNHAPVEINYQADKKRVLAPDFKYIMDLEGQSALQSARRYFTELDAPMGAKVPDIIQMIHWGIGFYLMNPVTKDPSGGDEGRKLHPQTLEQFAYFLYAYPYFKKYFTPKFYDQVKDMAFNDWAKIGLLDVFTEVGTAKGREAPGHSILPNLLMYEVATREKRADADEYFKAAFKQTDWIIKNLDFNDPKTTKGQRMSEHKLIPALVYLLQRYPGKAPKGLKDKIVQWVDIAISRSDNLWDFRRYDLDKNWSVPEFSETGNIAGFSGIALAAAKVTDSPEKRRRLIELAIAAQDDLLGRNPQNSASAYHPDLGFTGLEKGWPKGYKRDVCARLELVRGTLSSISTTDMYPYNPQGKFGHLEGWTAFNAAWNVSLAYMNDCATQINIHIDEKSETLQIVLNKPALYSLNIPHVISMVFNADIPTELSLQPMKSSQSFSASFPLKDIPVGTHEFLIKYGDELFHQQIKAIKKDGHWTIQKAL